MAEGKQLREPFDVDKLFRSTMERKWDEVLKAYEMYEAAHSARLTKSEETALHIAVSSYHEDLDAEWIRKLVDTFSTEEADKVLGMPNDKGNTPLHLAAALGSVDICTRIASKSHELMKNRNRDGETPLFLAAKHGKADAFGCLYNVWKEKVTEEIFRRYDGCTILHEAIRGEYFDLAYQIILKHKSLAVQNNAEGLSPLHILAMKPSVFHSSSHLRLCDHFIYQCLIVRKLREKDFVTESFKNSSSHSTSNGKHPDNYETCMNLVRKSWSFFKIILGGNNTGKSAASRMPEMEEKYDGSFPPNYATCINLFKFAMNIVLIILGVDLDLI